MRTITRNTAPTCLANQPEGQDWAVFMGTPCHAEVGTSLRAEQYCLCCYCESEVDCADCHIEHMVPRSANSTRTYDYANLASSCNGGAVDHCGRFKDDKHRNRHHAYDAALFCSPHDPTTVALFEYLIDGTVAVGAAADVGKARYMIGYLGLDCARLTERRKAHARALVDTLGADPQADLLAWARTYYLQPDATGQLRQFHSLSRAILRP